MAQTTFEQVLEECRAHIGTTPRSFPFWWYLTYLYTPMPSWAIGDPLMRYFWNQKKVFTEGIVVWGHVVQANNMMFRYGMNNCPGELVYCTDLNAVVDVSELAAVARRLYQLKGERRSHPREAAISKYLANERIRVFGMPVPDTVSPAMTCATSTVFFDRKHLPNRMLTDSLMPILVMDSNPRFAMVLPSYFWPDSLKAFWCK